MASISLISSLLVLVFVLIYSNRDYLSGGRKQSMVLYAHAIIAGPDATSFVVAGVNGTTSNLLGLGTVNILDHPVTEGPDPASNYVGRIQGMEASSDRRLINFLHVTSVIFENEKYNGSTLELQGANRFRLPQREVSVVGGTGQFRYARGYAVLEVISFVGVNISFRFNVTVQV